MGCCSSVKTSEEEEIIKYFNKLLKEQNFNLDIKTYDENYNIISKLSGNNFKKLCKKQKVRFSFIKKIKEDKKKEDDIQKILYNIMILTILLENKIIEELDEHDTTIKKDLINLKVGLISFGILFLDGFSDISHINNNKKILYYLARLFSLCFEEFIDENGYISINKFINNSLFFIDNNCFQDDEEKYIFIRDIILSLSKFFRYNINYFLEEKIIERIIELYFDILYHHYNYFESNYKTIKENINKNIRNTTGKLMNFTINVNKKDTILPNLKQIIISFNNNEQNYKDNNDIDLIIESIYFFLKSSSQDINNGKKMINTFGVKLQINEENANNEFKEIILLLLSYECCIKDDEILALCLMEYITDLFLNNYSNKQFNEKNIYYDIILDSYYLIYKNETLFERYISLLSQIFIKEIENNSKNSLFINQLIQIYYKKEKMINKLIELFFNFIVNISQYYKEKINIINSKDNISNEMNNNLIDNLLINLIAIIKTHFINNNSSNLINDNNYIISSTNNYTYNNNYDNKKYSIPIKIVIEDYEIIINNFFNFNKINEEKINIIEFYLYFHLFIINYLDISELINDFSRKEKIYYNLFKIITKFEIDLIQDSEKENNLNLISKESLNNNNFDINNIIIVIQLILKIIEINNSNNIQDCYILYKSIEINIRIQLDFHKKNENGNNEIDCLNLKIIYSIILFFLFQFIRLVNIPISIEKLHKEILECINKSHAQYRNLLSSIDVSNFIAKNISQEPNIEYLKELLSTKEEKEEKKEKFLINYNSLKQLLDIIYSKLFGKDSSLNIFFDNQTLNSKYFENNVNYSYNKSISKINDNITEVKDNSLINNYENNYNENYLEDISIHIDEKNKQKNNDGGNSLFISNENESKINIPLENEEISSVKRINSNSITNDDNKFNNIKI